MLIYCEQNNANFDFFQIAVLTFLLRLRYRFFLIAPIAHFGSLCTITNLQYSSLTTFFPSETRLFIISALWSSTDDFLVLIEIHQEIVEKMNGKTLHTGTA